MATHPLIDGQLGQFTDRMVLKTGEIWRIEQAARDLRAREFTRLVRAGWKWVKTHLVEPIASALEAERAYRELMALSDRELADIGVSRSDIPAIVARSIAPRAERKRTVAVKAVATVAPAKSKAKQAA
jgi:uncharacterized protein YjiS (DUF1127 family)